MEYRLNSEDFLLSMTPQTFEQDIGYPSNTILHVTVQSDGFSGSTTMDVGIKDLQKFAWDLCRVYETLSGEARIAEPYGMHMALSFAGNGRGQITVQGRLHKSGRTGNKQELQFEHTIDQTDLRDFCHTLRNSVC